MKTIVPALVLSALCLSSQVLAQPAAPRGVVTGLGGVTFVTETSSVFAGGVGLTVHERVQVVAEIGRLTNVLPRDLQRELDQVAASMGSRFGGPLSIDGKARGVYGLGLLRLTAGGAGRAHPYAEVGAGVARGASDISARAGGADVSREVLRAMSVTESQTRALVAAGGGVALELQGRLGLDVGYRYLHLFTDPVIGSSALYTGLRFGF